MWWRRKPVVIREPMTEFERVLLSIVRAHIRDLLETTKLSRREYRAMEHGAWIGHISTMEMLERQAR